MAAPLKCRSAQNDVCGQFQPCTSAQTNPTPDLSLSLTPTLTPTFRGARGRHEVGRGSPARHTSLMNFTWTSKNLARTCEYVYVWWTTIPLYLLLGTYHQVPYMIPGTFRQHHSWCHIYSNMLFWRDEILMMLLIWWRWYFPELPCCVIPSEVLETTCRRSGLSANLKTIGCRDTTGEHRAPTHKDG